MPYIFVSNTDPEIVIHEKSTPPPPPRTRPELGVRSFAEEYADVPHIVKFSGGRSSGALAFLLAEAGALRPERGDAILFANTSAEHPGTYKFARECKARLEHDFGLPFFWFEFCTVEDAARGTYSRRPSYRLVRSVPIEDDPYGYRHSGEVFEEMLSYQGMLPNPHARSCTAKLKLHPSHQLLAEWLGGTEGPRHAGHHGDRRYLSPEAGLANYRRSGGKAPGHTYLGRVDYMHRQPAMRSAQRWSDFTDAPVHVASSTELAPMWGPNATMHITLLGLRADEPRRIDRVLARSMFAEGAGSRKCQVRNQPPGERPQFPLADWGYDDAAIRRFWSEREPELTIPEYAGNCVFCFMKGTRSLRNAASAPDPHRVLGTPSDVRWWEMIERRYAREVPARDGSGNVRFGFFGKRGPTFSEIADGEAGGSSSRYAHGVPACDCTD